MGLAAHFAPRVREVLGQVDAPAGEVALVAAFLRDYVGYFGGTLDAQVIGAWRVTFLALLNYDPLVEDPFSVPDPEVLS